MKTITIQDRDLILDIRNEGLSSLEEGILEKDLLITDALHAVSTMLNKDIIPIFCGGTCLSKAHGLIERMSEDIDFKLVVPDGLSRNGRSRLLSQYKQQLAVAFAASGFDVPVDRIKARNENQYISLDLHYESRFAPVTSLRPAIKVEVNARAPMLQTVRLPVTSMLDSLAGRRSPDIRVDCVSLEETLSEKVVSFLRRTAEAKAGRNRGDYDDRLVRHLYDVRCILKAHPEMELPVNHFSAIAKGDAGQYRNQYPEFLTDPIGQMRIALTALTEYPAEFEGNYLRFVDDLVFGDRVSFAEASQTFTRVAGELLQGMSALHLPEKVGSHKKE
jgi:predicted nucleotidyltransferase component of viral defense system